MQNRPRPTYAFRADRRWRGWLRADRERHGRALEAPVPVFHVASPSGGSAPVTSGLDPYPIAASTWTQRPGEINVVFGAAAATLAYDESGQGSCRVFFEINLYGQQVGDGEVSTSSATPRKVEQSIGAQPQIDPSAPITNHLNARTGSNGACTAGSTIDSTRFRVLDFG